MFGIIEKTRIDSKPVRPDIVKCLKTLRFLLKKIEINSIGIVRDLGILTLAEWSYFISLVNKTFR